MRVCLMIEGQEGVTWDQWVSLALACEEHGFDALFRSDHYLSFGFERERGTLDAWAVLNAIAARTERIRLGTLVSPVTFRHPAVLAKMAITADHVSNGRIELGMGGAWYEREHAAFGFPFPPLGERMDELAEQIEIVHRLLNPDDAVVSFEGERYRLDDVPSLPKPVQTPHLPLILGGQGGPRSTRLAARWADEYNVHNKTPQECRAVRERLFRACERSGRDPGSIRFSLMLGALIGADRADLEDRARRLMERNGDDREPGELLAGRRDGEITGTVEQALEQLGALAEAGVERVMLQHLPHEDLEFVALVGREIIPAVSGL